MMTLTAYLLRTKFNMSTKDAFLLGIPIGAIADILIAVGLINLVRGLL